MFGNLLRKVGTAMSSAAETDAKKTLGMDENAGVDPYTKEFGDAVIAACCLTAAADGSIDDDEISKIVTMLETDPVVSKMGASVIAKTMERYVGMLRASFLVNKPRMINEIKEGVKPGTDDSNILIAYMVETAMSSGDVEDKEKAIINTVAKMLSVDTKEFFAAM